MKKTLFFKGMILLGVFFMLSGCNKEVQSDLPEESENEEREPITLTFMMWDTWGQGFHENIKEVVENEFPWITVENVGGDTGNREWIEDALTNGIVPDIIFAHRQYHVALLEEYQLGYDMTELIEKHGFDLNRYEKAHLDEWKSWTGGEIWLLPFMRDVYALHYNKDIFDAFGVEYPHDGMTWPEVLELAQRVTGERNDVYYIGIDLRWNNHLPLSQILGRTQLIDPETDEVLWVDSPYVKQWLEMVERAHQLHAGAPEQWDDWQTWVEMRNLALRPLWLDMATPPEMNFDIVTFPQWEDAPNIGPLYGGWALGITEPSPHKDAAMEVIKFLYRDEHIGRLGESPIHAPFNYLFTDANMDDFLEGERLEKFKGKNLQSMYILEPAGGPEYRSKHDVGAFQTIENLGVSFIESGLDVNTFLRELKEKEEIRIQEEKGRN